MTLNKHQGIRAALCWNAEIAHLARQHNDANILVMPGRFISTEEADMILTEFFSTEFEGGRHQKRIDKIPVKWAWNKVNKAVKLFFFQESSFIYIYQTKPAINW